MVTINEAIRAELERAAGLPRPKRQGLTPSKQAERMAELGYKHTDDMYWTQEFGTPEMPETTIQEGTMKTICSSENSRGGPCRAPAVNGTERCRYHTVTTPPPVRPKEVAFVTRGKDGPMAIKGAIFDSLHNRTFITIATAARKGKPQWKRGNVIVDRVTDPRPDTGVPDVYFSGKAIPMSSRTIWAVRPAA